MEDNNYCVYLHRRCDNDNIIYVGEGRESRAKATSKASCRNKRHCAILQETQIYHEIYRNNLTKQQAELLEKELIGKLISEGVFLTNRNKSASTPINLKREDFSGLFILDETSPSGLRWKTDRITGCGRVIVRKGNIAGCKLKTGYWRYKNRLCHRIVYALFHGECPANLTIDHIDNNNENNSILNLQILSRNENSVKSHSERTYATGEDAGSCLTKEDVIKIYEMFENYYNDSDIAKIFNVRTFTITRLRKGERWKDLYLQQGKEFPVTPRNAKCNIHQVEKVLKLFNEIKSNKVISELTGVNIRTIRALRLGTGLKEMVKIIQTKGK